jgi:hypothetical protein
MMMGLPLLVSMAAMGATPAAGPLRVGTVNPRYFVDPDGRPVYLTGSHTWQSLQDGVLSGYTVVTQPFDYTGYSSAANEPSQFHSPVALGTGHP